MLMNSKSINANQPVKRNRSGGGRPFHSRLEPFTGFIREQRQPRRTWQEIAAQLRTEKDCVITRVRLIPPVLPAPPETSGTVTLGKRSGNVPIRPQ